MLAVEVVVITQLEQTLLVVRVVAAMVEQHQLLEQQIRVAVVVLGMKPPMFLVVKAVLA
jgi:hypothetical protein